MSATDKHTLALGVPAQTFPIGSVDARMIGVMRCLLALSALAIVALDPTESRRFVSVTAIAVLAYGLWSAASLWLATRRVPLLPPRHEHWVDVVFAACMVALTQGNSSIFFFLFLFAILVASFSRGFAEGFYVTLRLGGAVPDSRIVVRP